MSGSWRAGITCQRHEGTLLRVMKMFYIFIVVVIAQICTSVKFQVVYLKQVPIILCTLYLNKVDINKYMRVCVH